MAEQVGRRSCKIIWENNAFIQCVVGVNNCHLRCVEKACDVFVGLRGNELFVQGEPQAVERAVAALNAAYDLVAKGHILDKYDFNCILSSSHEPKPQKDVLRVARKNIAARSANQKRLVQCLQRSELVFALGSAGTGKTYLSVAYGLKCLLEGMVKKLVLVRPAVEAGENLGFLPGDMKDKVDPYMMPLYDALYDIIDKPKVNQLIELNKIEIAPLAFMRGRTLARCFVVLDEAQNATCEQMKMFLTRLGESSRMAITGDPTQVDLVRQKSGLRDAVERLRSLDSVGCVCFEHGDVVRHALVQKIIAAYDKKL